MSEIVIVEADLEPTIIEVITEGPRGDPGIESINGVEPVDGVVTLTKNDLELSNVEDKSSATIRGEMTPQNVTDALGFTPLANSYAPSWAAITGKPTFSDVAISGSYNDLSDKPASYSLPTSSTDILGGVRVDGTSIGIAAGVISTSAAAIGLGSVENKSSATIRSEITSANVTAALGFTPLTNTYEPSWASITGRPSFANVAISGAYSDLTGTPTPYSLPTGSTTTLGGFKIDGSTIIAVAGVLSAVGDVSDYTALRAYTGSHTALRVSGYTASGAPLGINGLFTVDTTDSASADNGGTVIVANDGKRWKRIYDGNIDVRWFGAKGDGVTDDQAALAAAIAWAYFTGEEINWAAGTYASTGNLSNFHSVRHTGRGIVKRGSNLFYVSPTGNQTNNLFVSTTGSATNDGLSSSQPITAIAVQTVIKACNTLYGQWYVNYAAGTYTRGIFLRGIHSTNRIVFAGPSVGGHPNVPTAIFDGSTSAEQAAFFFQRMNVQIQDIKCQNFISVATGYGICADEFASLLTVNVHTSGNQYAGICADDGSVVRVSGGIHNANLFIGLRAHDNSMVTFGYQGGVSTNRPIISNNPIGVAFLSGAQGHVDYSDISNSSQYGITVEDCSRVHVSGTTIGTSTLADIRLNGKSSWYNDSSITNTLSSSTPVYEDNVSSAQSLASYVKTQFDKTSSASYSNVPGLEITLEANCTYIFEAVLSVTSGASGGVACSLGGTATASSVMSIGRVYNGTTIAHAQKTTSRTGAVGSYTGIATEVEISGTIVCSGSGTLIIRFAQNASNATASSVLVNSSLSAIKLK